MEINNVLVTGGLGFVGGRIVQHLRAKHPRCLITVLDTRLPTANETVGEDPLMRYVQADVTSLSAVREALETVRPLAVVHSAGLVPPLAERYGRRMQRVVMDTNVEGTRHVTLAAKEVGARALVYTSSCTAVVDDFSRPYANIDERWPTVEPGKGSIYGESKALAEVIVRQANSVDANDGRPAFRTCSLRPAVIFGEGDYQLVPSIVSSAIDRHESVYRLGDGMNMWDVVYVGNVADAHVLALENLLSDRPTAAGEVFFIQNNEPISMRDFMLFIWKEFNGHIPPFEIGIPLGLGWIVGLLGEVYEWISGKPTTLSRGSVLDAVAMRYASGDKAKKILGYEPQVGLEEGLRRSCQEYAARLRSHKGVKES